MASDRLNDLLAFKSYLDLRLSDEGPLPTPHEILADWEAENQTDEEREETVRAIERGLADVAAGRLHPAREALAELRKEFNLPPLR